MSIDAATTITSAAQAANAASTTPAAAATAGTSSAQQDQFLRLLITQIKNQDPLNPMDNAQMTTQMAQMSSLQGIERLNATLESLAANLTGNQAVQAAALVGHDVMAPGSEMQLAAGRAVGGVQLPQAVDRLQVTISDASGSVIHRAELGAQAQGIVRIEWDGTADSGAAAAAGRYQFSVTATAHGQAVASEPLMVGRVQAVMSGQDGTNLDLGTLGNVRLAQVRRFL